MNDDTLHLLAAFVQNVADTPLEGEDHEGFDQVWDEEGLRTRLLDDLVFKARELIIKADLA